MDGLTLLNQIRKTWPQCRVIFLTGYNNFEYVYTAIKYNGVDFLLKTEDDAEIIKLVEKSLLEIEETCLEQEIIEKSRQQIAIALPLLKADYLASILSGDETLFPVTQHQLDELGIPLQSDSPVILLLGRIDSLTRNLSQAILSSAIYTVNEIVERFLKEKSLSVCILYHEYHMAWLVQPCTTGDEPSLDALWQCSILFIRETLEAIQNACLRILSFPVSFSLSCSSVAWNQLSERFIVLKQLLNSGMGYHDGVILTDDIGKHHHKLTDISFDRQLSGLLGTFKSKVNYLQSYLDRDQRTDFTRLFNTMTGQIRELRNSHSPVALEMYYSIALIFLSTVNRSNFHDNLLYRADVHKLTSLDEFGSWDDAITFLRQLAEAIFKARDSEQEQVYSDTIKAIRHYISEHIGDDISLVRLSEMTYFNPSYLSRLFKQQTNMNITKYIQEVRMDKAREMLAGNNKKIYEIAADLGYDSPAYFSKVFRRSVGLTPQEYRDTLITGK